MAAWLFMSAAVSQPQSFVCRETVQRYRNQKHVDTVTASMAVADGLESYSDILRNGQPVPSLADLEGAWSRGEYSALYLGTHWTLSLEGCAYPLSFREHRSRFRVERVAEDLPKRFGIVSITWGVALQDLAVSRIVLTVPELAWYVVRYPDRIEANRISFSHFQRFAATSIFISSSIH